MDLLNLSEIHRTLPPDVYPVESARNRLSTPVPFEKFEAKPDVHILAAGSLLGSRVCLKSVLEEFKLTVRLSAGGMRSWSSLLEWEDTPTVVVIDSKLTAMTADRMLQGWRRQGRSDTYALLVGPESLLNLDGCGHCAVLVKPFEFGQLKRNVQAVLARQQIGTASFHLKSGCGCVGGVQGE